MNIIRTTAIELDSIPAIAYKQKLANGGAGIRILMMDSGKSAVYTIDKRSGDPVPYGPAEAEIPEEALQEALSAVVGLPYSSRGKIKIAPFETAKEEEDVTEAEIDAIDMVDSPEYGAIIDRYTDDKGKVNFPLMNKDFIQFASRNKFVGDLISNRALEEEIITFIVSDRAAQLAGKKDHLTKEQTAVLIETLDEIDPRSALKELKEFVRRKLAKR